MEAEKVSRGDWVRQWMVMLDRRQPGWREGYDREGLELAVQDLFGGEPAQELHPEELEVLGEFTARQDEETAELSARALAESPAFRRALLEFSEAFRSERLGEPGIRERRARAMRDLIEALLEPLERRFVRIARALGMREVRRARRHPAIPAGAPLAEGRTPAPEAEALAREAAERVARRLREELPGAAVGAVRRFLLDPANLPACEAAERSGISPATMTRALRRVREIAAEELEGCRDSILGPFTRALLERIA